MPVNPLQGVSDSKYRIFYVPTIIFGFLYLRPGTITVFVLDLPYGIQFNPYSDSALLILFMISLYSTYLMHNAGRLVFGASNVKQKNTQIALRHIFGILLDYEPSKLPSVPKDFTNIEEMSRFAKGLLGACNDRKLRAIFIFIPAISYSVFEYISVIPLLFIVSSNSGEYLAGGLLFAILVLITEKWIRKLIPIEYLEPDDYQSIYLAEYERLNKLDTKQSPKPRFNKDR